jgi:uncharacterized protein (DUF302 family)
VLTCLGQPDGRTTVRLIGRRIARYLGRPKMPNSPSHTESSEAVTYVSQSRWLCRTPAGSARILTYEVPASYDKVRKQLRNSFKGEDLCILAEIDILGCLRQELGVALKPCVVFCVDSPCVLLEAAVTGVSAVGYLPVHLVVSQKGQRTTIQLVSPAQDGMPTSFLIRFEKFLARVARILECLGGGMTKGGVQPGR